MMGKRRRMRIQILLLATMASIAACTPETPVSTSTSTSTSPSVTVPVPGATTSTTAEQGGWGTLVVETDDGSVLLIDPIDGTSEQIHRGRGAGAVAVQPTGSHDGQSIVWTSLDGAQPVVSMWTNGVDETFAPPFAPFFYMFSPDDTHVAMLGNDPSGGVGLAVLDRSTGVVKSLDTGSPYFIDWRPDSTALAAHIGASFVGTVDLAGTRAFIEGTHGVFQAPAWASPDEMVTVLMGAVEAHTGLSPVSLRLGAGEITVVNPSTGARRSIATVPGAVNFQVSPNGLRLAFVTATEELASPLIGPLTVVSVEGGERVAAFDGLVLAYEWSPSGRHLLMLTTTSDGHEVVPMIWDGSDVVELSSYRLTGLYLTQYFPFWDQYSRTLTTWAPDGLAFAYAAASEDGTGEIWIQPLDGERRSVGPGEFVSWIGPDTGASTPFVP